MIINKMLLNDAYHISKWKYDEPYTLYNFDDSPEDIQELMDGSYFRVQLNNELIGFLCFGYNAQVPDGRAAGLYNDNGKNFIDFGLGMKPDLCGHGNGLSFVQAGLEFAIKRFKPKFVRLSVATFNIRAISVYSRIGFSKEQTFFNNETEFLIMKYEV
ncbi:GNAT family N-acetyltransferase [Bacillus sp. SM2101]|uniref:GNAT family N-acetyltransferase n=1 Tax=Bacillus sp. SM2101 TaxID=2805366 RepID=UPI001BDF388A|nr:GNAT family N-acetyltransferase [Bacillus sp. SM2101]